MKLIVVDGQGGGMGKAIAAQMRKAFPKAEILALGTNSAATAAMLKGGATAGATGENAILSNCAAAEKEDYILGTQGICLADAMLGEISPAIAAAVSRSRARKLLLPMSACGVRVMGVTERALSECLREMAEAVGAPCGDGQ